MTAVNIIHNDPGGLLAGLPQFDSTIQAAFQWLEQYVVFRGTIDVEVVVEDTNTGRFSGSGPLVFKSSSGGITTYEQTSVAESRTGVDVDPTAAEFQIFVDPNSDYVDQLWWDPTPLTLTRGEIPLTETDAFSVVLHELLHGMGFTGWRDPVTGALPGNYQSLWDALVSVADGRAFFTGASARSLLTRDVEVRLGGAEGATHLGAAPSSEPFLVSDIMNSYYFYLGERYLPARLDLAILRDLGWTLKPSTLFNVVDPFDDLRTGRYAVGYGTPDTIVGTATHDRLEGRQGNDTLRGSDGNDGLHGGSGDDQMLGGAGDDTFFVDSVADEVREPQGGGRDLVVTSVDFTLPANVENGRIAGSGAVGLTGNALDNLLYAGGGNNLLVGGSGLDTVAYAQAAGGVHIDLRLTDAQLTLSSGSDTLKGIENLSGSRFGDAFDGNALANSLRGGAGNDRLNGWSGDDRLSGGPGADTLTGGGGRDALYGGYDTDTDAFVFGGTLGADNVDRVLQFNGQYDELHLVRGAFQRIGPVGALPASAFRLGSAAADADDRIVYQQGAGKLFFDTDGSGSAAAVLFAQLDPGTVLSASDLWIV